MLKIVKIFFYYKNLHISKIIYKFALPNLNRMKKDKRNKTKNDSITTTKPINRKGVVMFGDRYVDMERVLVPRTNKKVKDFINELEPNFERILLYARNNGEKPFASVEHLKKWLIGNQEDYPKFSNDIFFYFLKKSKIETTK